MKNGYLHVCVICDASWSMQELRGEVLFSLKAYLREQLATLRSQMRLDVYLFSDDVVRIAHDVDLYTFDLDYLDRAYRCCGQTALSDAFCAAVDELGCDFSKLPYDSRPSEAVVVLITDGQDNASKVFALGDVWRRVSIQSRVYSWRFVFFNAQLEDLRERCAPEMTPSDLTGLEQRFVAAPIEPNLEKSNALYSGLDVPEPTSCDAQETNAQALENDDVTFGFSGVTDDQRCVPEEAVEELPSDNEPETVENEAVDADDYNASQYDQDVVSNNDAPESIDSNELEDDDYNASEYNEQENSNDDDSDDTDNDVASKRLASTELTEISEEYPQPSSEDVELPEPVEVSSLLTSVTSDDTTKASVLSDIEEVAELIEVKTSDDSFELTDDTDFEQDDITSEVAQIDEVATDDTIDVDEEDPIKQDDVPVEEDKEDDSEPDVEVETLLNELESEVAQLQELEDNALQTYADVGETENDKEVKEDQSATDELQDVANKSIGDDASTSELTEVEDSEELEQELEEEVDEIDELSKSLDKVEIEPNTNFPIDSQEVTDVLSDDDLAQELEEIETINQDLDDNDSEETVEDVFEDSFDNVTEDAVEKELNEYDSEDSHDDTETGIDESYKLPAQDEVTEEAEITAEDVVDEKIENVTEDSVEEELNKYVAEESVDASDAVTVESQESPAQEDVVEDAQETVEEIKDNAEAVVEPSGADAEASINNVSQDEASEVQETQEVTDDLDDSQNEVVEEKTVEHSESKEDTPPETFSTGYRLSQVNTLFAPTRANLGQSVEDEETIPTEPEATTEITAQKNESTPDVADSNLNAVESKTTVETPEKVSDTPEVSEEKQSETSHESIGFTPEFSFSQRLFDPRRKQAEDQEDSQNMSPFGVGENKPQNVQIAQTPDNDVQDPVDSKDSVVETPQQSAPSVSEESDALQPPLREPARQSYSFTRPTLKTPDRLHNPSTPNQENATEVAAKEEVKESDATSELQEVATTEPEVKPTRELAQYQFSRGSQSINTSKDTTSTESSSQTEEPHNAKETHEEEPPVRIMPSRQAFSILPPTLIAPSRRDDSAATTSPSRPSTEQNDSEKGAVNVQRRQPLETFQHAVTTERQESKQTHVDSVQKDVPHASVVSQTTTDGNEGGADLNQEALNQVAPTSIQTPNEQLQQAPSIVNTTNNETSNAEEPLEQLSVHTKRELESSSPAVSSDAVDFQNFVLPDIGSIDHSSYRPKVYLPDPDDAKSKDDNSKHEQKGDKKSAEAKPSAKAKSILARLFGNKHN